MTNLRPTWQTTYAVHLVLPKATLATGLEPVVVRLREVLERSLSRDLMALLSDVTISMSDSPSDFFIRDLVACIAEARVLTLRNPDPMPDLAPFPWLRRPRQVNV